MPLVSSDSRMPYVVLGQLREIWVTNNDGVAYVKVCGIRFRVLCRRKLAPEVNLSKLVLSVNKRHAYD